MHVVECNRLYSLRGADVRLPRECPGPVESRLSILCVGQIVADVVVWPVDALPVPGRTDLVKELQLVTGGCAANTASVLAKFGADASIAGLIGRDTVGDALLADLVATGVHIEGVVRDPGVSTSAVVVIVGSTGERSFLYRTGGNERLSCEAVSDSALREADFMHVGGAMKLANLDLAALLARAKSKGCITSLDTDWDVSGAWSLKLDGALPLVDYLLTNHEEGSMLTGLHDPVGIGRALLSGGPKMVIVKLGERGAIAVSGDTVWESRPFDVSVVDTTCAGDSFVAGFLFGISQGWLIDDTLDFANAAGALCTTRISHQGISSFTATRDLALSRSRGAAPAELARVGSCSISSHAEDLSS